MSVTIGKMISVGGIAISDLRRGCRFLTAVYRKYGASNLGYNGIQKLNTFGGTVCTV